MLTTYGAHGAVNDFVLLTVRVFASTIDQLTDVRDHWRIVNAALCSPVATVCIQYIYYCLNLEVVVVYTVHTPEWDWRKRSSWRLCLSIAMELWKFHHKMNEQINSTAFSGVWIKFQRGSSASQSASAAMEIGMQCRRRPCRFTIHFCDSRQPNQLYLSTRELSVLIFTRKTEDD